MREKLWKISYRRPEAPEALLRAGYPPLLCALLERRGVESAEEAEALLEGGSEQLYDPLLMKNMGRAAARLQQAIVRGETVAVYGDYDVDGITATCLLTEYLRGKGLTVYPYIPDRGSEGYGINGSAIDALREKGVTLLVSVDCGITAAAETAHANELGMEVIITDHHECGVGPLPAALAVVDPKQEGERYPNPYLAGVGVALKLACAIEGEAGPILERFSDLAALGTVADVMPLVGENRVLVRLGLKKLEERPSPGLAAILREAGVAEKKPTANIIGYSLAPRLNAAGRLGCAGVALQLLLTQDTQEAESLAQRLCELNRERQAIELGIWDEANAMLAGQSPDGPIVLSSETWHQGVIGIAASRLAEQYALPAVMVCFNGDVGKGSCRSFGGFNLFEALSACSEYLTGFGGHALAAGLNLERSALPAFREALRQYYREHRPEPVPEVLCDLLITDPTLLSEENVRSLDLLEPFGSENPRPVFCLSDVVIEALTPVGNGRHLRLRVGLRGKSFECIFFSHTAEILGIHENSRVDLAFTPQINEYRGHSSVQLQIQALRLHQPAELCRGILELDGGMLWAAAPYRPRRSDFVRIWRLMERPGFALGGTVEEILAQCPPGLAPERFCLCLGVLRQAGLLDGIYGGKSRDVKGKADLEATELMRSL